MKLGLISDTHGYLDPRLEKIFAGVEHIFHAGDIGPDFIIAQLEAIAPVTAVLGNNDNSPTFPLTQVKQLGDLKFLVHHIVSPHALTDDLKTRISKTKPDVVIFGHSHRPFQQQLHDVLFINPGYSGKPKFGLDRSVAVMDYDGKEIQVRLVKLYDAP